MSAVSFNTSSVGVRVMYEIPESRIVSRQDVIYLAEPELIKNASSLTLIRVRNRSESGGAYFLFYWELCLMENTSTI